VGPHQRILGQERGEEVYVRGRGRTINMSIVWSTIQWFREKARVVALSKQAICMIIMVH